MARLSERLNEIGISDPIPFGEYFGIEVEEVLVDDPQYLVWMRDNTQVQFDEEVLQRIEHV